MHDKPIDEGAEGATTAGQDHGDQGRVLGHILFVHPGTLTLDELVRELTFGSDRFGERDRVERAVRDLVGGGLLRRVGELVLPTRAAVNFSALGRE